MKTVAEIPSGVASIAVYVEGADGLHGRPFMPDHAIDVMHDLAVERARADVEAGHTRDLDDAADINDLVFEIEDRVNAAAEAWTHGDRAEARRRMLQVAVLAVSTVESIDRRTGAARPDEPQDTAPAGPGVDPEETSNG